jgi:hypothetical protein
MFCVLCPFVTYLLTLLHIYKQHSPGVNEEILSQDRVALAEIRT